jgi:hypothetical protein
MLAIGDASDVLVMSIAGQIAARLVGMLMLSNDHRATSESQHVRGNVQRGARSNAPKPPGGHRPALSPRRAGDHRGADLMPCAV